MGKVKGHWPLIYGPGQQLSSGLWLQRLAWGRGRGGGNQVESGWVGGEGTRERGRVQGEVEQEMGGNNIKNKCREEQGLRYRYTRPYKTVVMGSAAPRPRSWSCVWVSEQCASISQKYKFNKCSQ